jgi:catalase
MPKPIMTRENGCPLANDQVSTTAGQHGPLTFDNLQLFEKLAHFNRERIPERVVHARGTGAYGTFTLNKSLSEYTCASFLQKAGETTDIYIRFSTVGGGQDSSDYARDPRGFAVRFYTDEGNWDMVGNNTPVFFLRDPIKFPDFIHSQKKDPRTNIASPAAMFEFWSQSPQSLHQMTILMSDRGIPASYRHMDGFSSHTLSLWNKDGQRYWVKWHFKTNQGIKNVASEDAGSAVPHGAQADLVEAIDNGDFPSWRVGIQIMSEEEAQNFDINPFDLTKVWSHKKVPLQEIGVLELNRNVTNYFAEVEQVALSPSNFVPGIGASPDKMLQGRLMAYPDAQRYRLGANYNHLPVNQPKCPVMHYQRDGHMAGTLNADKSNQHAGTNFYPNQQTDTAEPKVQFTEPPMPLENDAWVKAYDDQGGDNFSQAGDLFRIMSDAQKDILAANIAGGLSQATPEVQAIMLEQFNQADADYAARVKALL